MTKKIPDTVAPQVAKWIDSKIERIASLLTSEASRRILVDHTRDFFRHNVIDRLRLIQAAEVGHEDIDSALRQLVAEYISRREEMPTELAAFAQRAMLRPPSRYPAGANVANTWVRDVGIAVVVKVAVEIWQIPKTRNRASKRPSACSLMSEALVRHGHNLGERQVERIATHHDQMAEKLSAILSR